MHNSTSLLARQVLIEKEVEELQRSIESLSQKLSKYLKDFKDKKRFSVKQRRLQLSLNNDLKFSDWFEKGIGFMEGEIKPGKWKNPNENK